MSEKKTLKTRIQMKKDSKENWDTASNKGFIPLEAEAIVYTKGNGNQPARLKIGDGTSKVNQLPFATPVIDTEGSMTVEKDLTVARNVSINGAIKTDLTVDGKTTFGKETQSLGDYSHAEGLGTIASGNYQHVQGKYNLEDTENKYAHIIGNGDKYSRSNLHTLDWSGNAWFAGELNFNGVLKQRTSDMCRYDLPPLLTPSSNNKLGEEPAFLIDLGTINCSEKNGASTLYYIHMVGASSIYDTASESVDTVLQFYYYRDKPTDNFTLNRAHAKGYNRGCDVVDTDSPVILYATKPDDVEHENLYLYIPINKNTVNNGNNPLHGLEGIRFEIISSAKSLTPAVKFVNNSDEEWQQLKYTARNTTKGDPFKIKSSTVGDAYHPVYIKSGVPKQCTNIATIDDISNGNVTSAKKLVDENGGEVNVGSGDTPIYFSNGKPVKSDKTVGSSSQPVYVDGGKITPINSISGMSVEANSINGAHYPVLPEGVTDFYVAVPDSSDDLHTHGFAGEGSGIIGYGKKASETLGAGQHGFNIKSITQSGTTVTVTLQDNDGGKTDSKFLKQIEKLRSIKQSVTKLYVYLSTSHKADNSSDPAFRPGIIPFEVLSISTDGVVTFKLNAGDAVGENGIISDWTDGSWDNINVDLNERLNYKLYFRDYPELGTTIVARGAFASGRQVFATGDSSFAQGRSVKAIGDYSHAEGKNTFSWNEGSHAEGIKSEAMADAAHAEGNKTEASGKYSHSEGNGTTASGEQSHAEGCGTIASGGNSHAEGLGTKATGTNQHVSGKYNKPDASKAVIIGGGTSDADSDRKNIYTLDWDGNVRFSGIITAKEKINLSGEVKTANTDIVDETVAKKFASFSTGNENNTEAINKVKGKTYTKAVDDIKTNKLDVYYLWKASAENPTERFSMYYKGCSLARRGITFTGAYTEGCETVALGDGGSHAEGYQSAATDLSAHAEGHDTLASAQAAHAEGYGTIAASACQHVSGKYNIEDKTGKYAHIVGWGTGASQSARKNIYTLSTAGNGWFAGNLEVDGKIKLGKSDLAGGELVLEYKNDGCIISTASKLTILGNDSTSTFNGISEKSNAIKIGSSYYTMSFSGNVLTLTEKV